MSKKFSQEIIRALKNAKATESLTTSKNLQNAIVSKNSIMSNINAGIIAIGEESRKNIDNLRIIRSGDNNSSVKDYGYGVQKSVYSSDSAVNPKLKKSFLEKHNDEQLLEFLIKKDNNYYDPNNIDDNKDMILQELKNLRDIVQNPELLETPSFLSKEIALFYTSKITHNGQNRGQVFNRKCEMYRDKYQEDPQIFIEKDLSAEKLVSIIEIEPSKYQPNVVMHSKMTKPNCESYKHAHELLLMKKISAETGTEIFATADCSSSDPEFLKWKGKLEVVEEQQPLQGQTHVDLYQKITTVDGEDKIIHQRLVRGDIKHKAVSLVTKNKQLGSEFKPQDTYISCGTADSDQMAKIQSTVAENILTKKYAEYAKAMVNPNTPPEEFARLDSEIKNLLEYKTSGELEKVRQIDNILKTVFNKDNIKLNIPLADKEKLSPDLEDNFDDDIDI